MKSVENMSVQELESILAKKKNEESAQEKAIREKYEKERDYLVKSLCKGAMTLNDQLKAFSETGFMHLREHAEKLSQYGKMRKNSKGGFNLQTADGEYKIKYAYTSIADFDERANKAEELLKDFLQDFIKKKDKGAYYIIMSLMERNNRGQLEFSRIQKLYKFENDYNDARWKEAIKLFKESFNVKGSKMQLYFYKRNQKGEFELINLNFSSL